MAVREPSTFTYRRRYSYNIIQQHMRPAGTTAARLSRPGLQAWTLHLITLPWGHVTWPMYIWQPSTLLARSALVYTGFET